MSEFGEEHKKKPHCVLIPFPAQGHINPLLNLAKVLHGRGFFITFVNTFHTVKQMNPLADDLPGFRFAAITDGITPADRADPSFHLPAHNRIMALHSLAPFKEILLYSDSVVPPVSCVVTDGALNFPVVAAEEVGIPIAIFWTTSACGFMAYLNIQQLVDRALVPLKDESDLDNVIIDWIPGMRPLRLRDLPTFIRTKDLNNPILQMILSETSSVLNSKNATIILNTFEALEHDVLEALSAVFRPRRVLALGPLHTHLEKAGADPLRSVACNLRSEDSRCLEWLGSKPAASVLYVNFGSIAVMSPRQLEEFAAGLAASMKPFLWIVRDDLVAGDLPPGFVEETRGRGVLAGWCDQRRVLNHPAVGGYVMHCGWNSTLESLGAGVAVMCWPFVAEQTTNGRFLCGEWGVGMGVEGEVRRERVEVMVRELMDGERGRKMREKALEWKRKAEEATEVGGSSAKSLDVLINEVFGVNQERAC